MNGKNRTPSDAYERRVARIRRWAYLLDRAFRVPGTGMRFGWDGIIGLVPGAGDVLTGLVSLFLLIQSVRIRMPGVVRVRMLLNILIDIVVGAIPLLGDLFDFAWKANTRNLALLERYASGYAEPTARDWAFVLGTLAVILAVISIPVLVLAALLHNLPADWISSPSWKLLVGTLLL